MTTTVERAEETLLTHAANEGGDCGFCLLHYHLRIRAGTCAPYQQTAAFISVRRSEQARRRPVSPEYRHT
ncbi:hypothetical protein [Glycomyces sp. NPDC021274]|uniref:hypothetical protein n=1 Tax=Glycomyces sp. NPDC021274 TaxID=3155120 RepID=UPI0033E4A3A5